MVECEYNELYEKPPQEVLDRVFVIQTGTTALEEHEKRLRRVIDAMWHYIDSLDPNCCGANLPPLSYESPAAGTLTANVNMSKWMLNQCFQMITAMSAWHISQNHFPDPSEILEGCTPVDLNAFTHILRIQPKSEKPELNNLPGWDMNFLDRLSALEAKLAEVWVGQYQQTKMLYELHVRLDHFPDTCSNGVVSKL